MEEIFDETIYGAFIFAMANRDSVTRALRLTCPMIFGSPQA
jgi:hypothetical protein